MATITVKTATVRENGESVLKARVYKGSTKIWESDLRGNGYSSNSAYKSAVNSLFLFVNETASDHDTLKIEASLSRALVNFDGDDSRLDGDQIQELASDIAA